MLSGVAESFQSKLSPHATDGKRYKLKKKAEFLPPFFYFTAKTRVLYKSPFIWGEFVFEKYKDFAVRKLNI